MAQLLYSAVFLIALASSAFATDLKIIVPNATGGLIANARVVARYLPRYMGDVKISFQTIPGATGIIALNYLYNVSPRDGSEIAAVDSRSFMQVIAREPNVKYDVTKFSWLGSFIDGRKDPFIFWVRAGNDRLVGGSESSFSVNHINVISGILKLDVRNITGYVDQAQTKLAFERGEINLVAYTLTSIRTTAPHWINDTSIMPLVQYGGGRNRHPSYPNTPTVAEFCTGEDCKVLEAFEDAITLNRGFAAPPNTDNKALSLLRLAFASVMVDSDYLADAKTIGVEATPISWQEAEEIAKRMAKTSLDTVSRLKQF